jgi:Reverse transcriptase (RNA-dependent DNA polymerase)
LLNALHACMTLSYFPAAWKVGKIIAIPKPGKDPAIPTNYRPISLLSNIGKLFERLILTRLEEHEQEKNIVIPQQFGFRSEHSTVHQILRITEESSLGFNVNKSTGLVLLDLEKAFDSVWHDGLIHKLIQMKTPPKLTGIVDSYLSARKSYVCVNGKDSKLFDVPAGVPQGSLLSPHLFNIFINDVPLPKNCHLAIYADDTGLYCTVPWKNAKKAHKVLTEAVVEVSNFFKSWKIKLNNSKTEFIVFTKSGVMKKRLSKIPPIVDGVTLKWKDSVTYLGVELDQKLTIRPHINKVIAKARRMVSTLFCLLKRNSAVSERSKIDIYRSIVRPIMTYACPIFTNCAETHFKKLQIQQNKTLRMALNADIYTRVSDLHTESNVPTIREFVDKLTNNFYAKAENHKSVLINKLGKYALDDVRRKVKHRLPRKQI